MRARAGRDGVAGRDLAVDQGVDHGEAVPIVEPGSITMRVDGSEIGGRAACNIYGGTLDIDGNQITISALSMTEMACQEDLMASEAAYMAAIGGVDTAERTDDRLVLAGTDVELHYMLEPPIADASLAGTPWRLDSLITGEAVSSTMSDDATLELARGRDDQRVHGLSLLLGSLRGHGERARDPQPRERRSPMRR